MDSNNSPLYTGRRLFIVNRYSGRIHLLDFKSFFARRHDGIKFVHKFVSTYDLSDVLPLFNVRLRTCSASEARTNKLFGAQGEAPRLWNANSAFRDGVAFII